MAKEEAPKRVEAEKETTNGGAKEEDPQEKRGVLCLVPTYDPKELEDDYKTARGVAGAFMRVFYAEGRGLPTKIMEQMMDQGIALVLVVGSSEVKDYQQLHGRKRHVYVAPPRSNKNKGVDGVIYDVLKTMKSDGVVRALI